MREAKPKHVANKASIGLQIEIAHYVAIFEDMFLLRSQGRPKTPPAPKKACRKASRGGCRQK